MTIVEHWVAIGPVTGTAWCVLDNAPSDLLAPGGVVLCEEGTSIPHPDAAQAAQSAWAALDYQNQRHRTAALDAAATHLHDAHRAHGGHRRTK